MVYFLIKKNVALLCGAAVLLVLFLSSGLYIAHAATWLGIQQGVQSYKTSAPYNLTNDINNPGYPLPLFCYTNAAPAGSINHAYDNYPKCSSLSQTTKTIGVFSVHTPGVSNGQTIIANENLVQDPPVYTRQGGIYFFDTGENSGYCPIDNSGSLGDCTSPPSTPQAACPHYYPIGPADYYASNPGGSGYTTEGCYTRTDPTHSSYTTGVVAGSPINIAAGDQVTLEWSCQPRVQAVITRCTSFNIGGTCTNSGETVGTTNYFENGAVGSNFGSPGGGIGSMTVTAQSGTTQYSLSCGGSVGTQTLTLPVTVGSAPSVPGCTDLNANNYNHSATINDGSCTYPPAGCAATPPMESGLDPFGNGDVRIGILYNGTARRITGFGYDFCVSNGSGTNIFVPFSSGGELGSFYTTAPSIPGVTFFN
jgi:hypothetical protein